MSEDEVLERQKKFETFLHRQQQIAKRKEDHIRMVLSRFPIRHYLFSFLFYLCYYVLLNFSLLFTVPQYKQSFIHIQVQSH